MVEATAARRARTAGRSASARGASPQVQGRKPSSSRSLMARSLPAQSDDRGRGRARRDLCAADVREACSSRRWCASTSVELASALRAIRRAPRAPYAPPPRPRRGPSSVLLAYYLLSSCSRCAMLYRRTPLMPAAVALLCSPRPSQDSATARRGCRPPPADCAGPLPHQLRSATAHLPRHDPTTSRQGARAPRRQLPRSQATPAEGPQRRQHRRITDPAPKSSV